MASASVREGGRFPRVVWVDNRGSGCAIWQAGERVKEAPWGNGHD